MSEKMPMCVTIRLYRPIMGSPGVSEWYIAAPNNRAHTTDMVVAHCQIPSHGSTGFSFDVVSRCWREELATTMAHTSAPRVPTQRPTHRPRVSSSGTGTSPNSRIFVASNLTPSRNFFTTECDFFENPSTTGSMVARK